MRFNSNKNSKLRRAHVKYLETWTFEAWNIYQSKLVLILLNFIEIVEIYQVLSNYYITINVKLIVIRYYYGNCNEKLQILVFVSISPITETSRRKQLGI